MLSQCTHCHCIDQCSYLKINKEQTLSDCHLCCQVFGLPGLLCTVSMNINAENVRPTMHLYGPCGLRQFIRTSLRLSRSELCYNFAIHELLPVPEQLDDRSKVND